MVASTGRVLLADRGIDAYRRHLLPHALVVTPNLWEAALLAGVPTRRRSATSTPWSSWPGAIHGSGRPGCWSRAATSPAWRPPTPADAPDQVADVLFDGSQVTVLRGPHVDTPNTHGTGCSLSAAIAAHLARGADVPDRRRRRPRQFVHGALARRGRVAAGRGHGPLDHLGWNRRPAGRPVRR